MPTLTQRLRLPFVPTAGAIALAWLALTPSLLPRPAVFQGLLCGLAALLGYAFGALAGWIVRSTGLRLTGRTRRVAWAGLGWVGVLGTLGMLVAYLRWQGDLRDLVGLPGLGFGHLTLVLVIGLVVFGLGLGLARLLRVLGRFVGRQVARVLPPRVALVCGALLVATSTWVVVDSLLVGRLTARLDAGFMVINQEFSTDMPAPTSPHLSAGPDSLAEWDELGRHGRVFIANAPTPEEISGVTGAPALQPVRAYIGVGSEREVDLREEAQLAVAELERLGGFERAVVNVATGTGRGWVNENQAQALEYIWGGDIATVSIQYSYLPSWMSFLVDGQRAQDAGRLLFEAVFARWSELPEDQRPLLVVSGESLGSFGGEAAFAGAQDMAERTDGALFVGPTANNRLWRQFTQERDRGTPQILPVYQDGVTVRFSADGVHWPGTSDWEQPRIGYLQHANDPITWLDRDLALHRPDWLVEERGPGVLPQTTWIPVVTVLQVGADQLMANAVPAGQGHQFGQNPARAWATILPSPGWTEDLTERLVVELAERREHDLG